MCKLKVTILILAAGSSSRLGKPKQLLPWKRSNLLQWAIKSASETMCYRTVLVLGAYSKEILDKIDIKGVDVIENKNWKNGIGSSIAYGVGHIKSNFPETDAVLIMLADQPAIDSNYLKNIISMYNSESEQIIVSSYNNTDFGVPVLFDKFYFNDLLKLKSDEGAKQVINRNRSKIISINNKLNFEDIDTYEVYKRVYKSYH